MSMPMTHTCVSSWFKIAGEEPAEILSTVDLQERLRRVTDAAVPHVVGLAYATKRERDEVSHLSQHEGSEALALEMPSVDYFASSFQLNHEQYGGFEDFVYCLFGVWNKPAKDMVTKQAH